MPSIVKRICKQYCVYWSKEVGSDPTGQPVWKAPEELKCRWEDEMFEFVDQQGNLVQARSRVYVLETLATDGVLWKGKLVDLKTEYMANPWLIPVPHLHNTTGPAQIQRFAEIPDLKAKEENTTRIAFL